jgi:hypothetical protein
MVPDIIYEVLKHLYLCPEENGGALLAKKVLLSQKICRELDKQVDKLEKPIVFDVNEVEVFLESKIGATVYWGDGKNGPAFDHFGYLLHNYSKPGLYTIKFFDYDTESTDIPEYVVDVHSIGKMTNLSYMFGHSDISEAFGKKWDTTNVLDIRRIFADANIGGNIGKNWNFSNVINNDGIFAGSNIGGNIGKNWNFSSVINNDGMSSIYADKN